MQAHIFLGMATLVGLFIGMLVFLESGRRFRLRMTSEDAEKAGPGLGVVEGALFGLMGLVVAFTFSGAAARFDAKRQLIVEESNDIGTAYLRLDLLPEADQPALREDFRRYVDARLESYRTLPSVAGVMPQTEVVARLQESIWKRSIAATREAANPQSTLLLLPALNAMFDIANTRAMATQLHPPPIIFALLATLALVCSFLAGFGMAGGKGRDWIHILAFAAILTLTVYVIIDMEYPRVGLIRIEEFDQALIDVRASMK